MDAHLSEVKKRQSLMEQSSSRSSREKRWSLSGTTALVTGGTKGIGYPSSFPLN